MKTLEEKQAELKRKNIKQQYRKRVRTRKINAEAARVRGKYSTKADKWDFNKVMQEYKPIFDDIVDLVMATCRSQTKQEHPDKALHYLSKRILYVMPYINARHIDREEIEAELKYVWWMCYRRCVEKGWGYRSNLIKYSSYYLPQHIEAHITPVYQTNTDEISYELDLVEPFNIDLDYVINGSDVWPASLFDQKERYLIFLLQEHPGAYAKVANIMRVTRREIWYMINEIRTRITEELDINARQNTIRPSERRTLVSA